MLDTTRLTWKQATEQFFTSKRAAHLSEHTLMDYQNTFKKIGMFVSDDTLFQEIGIDKVTVFFANTMNVSAKTALNYHVGLSSLWT